MLKASEPLTTINVDAINWLVLLLQAFFFFKHHIQLVLTIFSRLSSIVAYQVHDTITSGIEMQVLFYRVAFWNLRKKM